MKLSASLGVTLDRIVLLEDAQRNLKSLQTNATRRRILRCIKKNSPKDRAMRQEDPSYDTAMRMLLYMQYLVLGKPDISAARLISQTNIFIRKQIKLAPDDSTWQEALAITRYLQQESNEHSFIDAMLAIQLGHLNAKNRHLERLAAARENREPHYNPTLEEMTQRLRKKFNLQ
jgi:hypothetical protein